MSKQLPLPHDVEAEMAVLGGVMRWSSQCFSDVQAILGEGAFYVPKSREIWLSMRSLHEQGRPLDQISVEADLRTRGKLEFVGGVQATGYVRARAPDRSSEIIAHATLIAELAQSRAAIDVMQDALAQLLTNPLTGTALATTLSAASEALTDVAKNGAGTSMPWTSKQVGDDAAAERQLEIDGKTKSISTGFPKLDRFCKRRGPRPGWLVVLFGRPKMGKTTAALQMAIEAMFERSTTYPVTWELKRNPTPVFIGCDEMRAVELYDRLLANIAGLDASGLGAPTKAWHDHYKPRIDAARRKLDKAPLVFVPDEDSSNLTKIFASIRRWRRTHEVLARDGSGNPIREPALTILDFLQSFEDLPGTGKLGLPERIGRRCKLIKNETKALGMVTILLSQCNRDVEKRDRDEKRPLPSDNEGSGKIEQYADIMIGCYRDIVYDSDEQMYKDQIGNLRQRVVDRAAAAHLSAAPALAELGELVHIHSDTTTKRRYDTLRETCYLGVTELEEYIKAKRKLSSAEFIVSANRHGPNGTVYVDFYGHQYRFLPRHRTANDQSQSNNPQ